MTWLSGKIPKMPIIWNDFKSHTELFYFSYFLFIPTMDQMIMCNVTYSENYQEIVQFPSAFVTVITQHYLAHNMLNH